MRYAFLIAWREYVENAKTKGFWIGLFMFPIIVLVSIQVPAFLATKGAPIRHFVLVDQSGQFDRVITDALERAHHRKVMEELLAYARRHGWARSSTNSAAARGPGDTAVEFSGGSVGRSVASEPSKVHSLNGLAARPDGLAPPPDSPVSTTVGPGERPLPGKSYDQLLRDLSGASRDGVDQFIRQGGEVFYLTQLRPYLNDDAPAFQAPRRRYQRVELPKALKTDVRLAELVQELKPYLRGARKLHAQGQPVDLFAAILVPADIEQRIMRPGLVSRPPPISTQGIEYWSGNLADPSLREEVERSVNSEIRRREYVSRGIDLATVQQVERTYVPFADLNPKKEAGQEKVSRVDVLRQWAPTGFVYLLWIAIFSIIQMLLNNTIEEKSNRIIEVLLSSVTPSELMMGKLAGIAAIGLTMVGAWIGSLVAVLIWKSGGQTEIAGELLKILRTTHLLPAFVVYFLLGYLLYGGLILTIGSICNTLKEAQNYMGTIVLLLMVPLMTMMFIPKDPNGTLATALSWVPIYTPFVMMNRAAADPPLFEVIGTMIVLGITTGVVLWLSGKIFRIGILRTGQPPKLIELIRWLKR